MAIVDYYCLASIIWKKVLFFGTAYMTWGFSSPNLWKYCLLTYPEFETCFIRKEKFLVGWNINLNFRLLWRPLSVNFVRTHSLRMATSFDIIVVQSRFIRLILTILLFGNTIPRRCNIIGLMYDTTMYTAFTVSNSSNSFNFFSVR